MMEYFDEGEPYIHEGRSLKNLFRFWKEFNDVEELDGENGNDFLQDF